MGFPITLLVVVGVGGGMLSWFAGRAVVRSKELSWPRKLLMASLTPVAVLVATVIISFNFSLLSRWGNEMEWSYKANSMRLGAVEEAEKEIKELLKSQGFSYRFRPDISENAQSGTILAWVREDRKSELYAFKRDGQWVLACQYGDTKKPLEGDFLKDYNTYGGCPVIDAVAPSRSTR
ncbi:MAG TPA: hypothetical protein VFZ48_02850 [Candidatus Saccharimonadales bacterium]